MSEVVARPVPPGEVLLEELAVRGWTQKDLADVLERPTQMVNEVIRGTKQITAETAVQLEAALNIPADAWLQLEARYRLALSREHQRSDPIARRSRLYSLMPIAEAQRRGWLPRAAALPALEEAVRRFLAMRTIDDEPETPASLRASWDRGPDGPSQRAWIRRVHQLASAQPSDSPPRLDSLVSRLQELSADLRSLADVPEVFRAHGVRLVLLPHLPKTFLDGAATYIGSKEPVVAVTLRYDRIDNFWFTIFHELMHLRRGDDTILESLFERTEVEVDEVEAAVNRDAANYLIPPAALQEFLSRTESRPTRDQISSFAVSIGRHPGIVVGRLQKDEVVDWSEHRPLLIKVRQHLEDQVAA